MTKANVTNVSDEPRKKSPFQKIAISIAKESTQKIIVGVIVFVAVPVIGTAIQNLFSSDDDNDTE